MPKCRHPHQRIGGKQAPGAYRAIHKDTGAPFWFVFAQGYCPRRRKRIGPYVVQLPQCRNDWECMEWARTIRADIVAGRFERDAYTKNLTVTIGEFREQWLRELRARKYAKATVDDWTYNTAEFVEVHGYTPIAMFQWKDLERRGSWLAIIRDKLNRGDISRTTALRKKKRCKKLIAMACARDIRTDPLNPFDGVKFRAPKKRQKREQLSRETIRAAFSRLYERELTYCQQNPPRGNRYLGNFVPWLIQFETLRRPGEVLSMEWTDLLPESKLWLVRGPREHGTRSLKSSEADIVPLSDHSWKWLAWHREQQVEFGYELNHPEHNPYVFPSRKGVPSRSGERFRKSLALLREENILPPWFSANNWRHVGTTEIAQSFGEVVSTMLAGHSVNVQRQVYRLQDIENMRAASEAQADVLAGLSPDGEGLPCDD